MKPHSLIIGGTKGIGRALAKVLAAGRHQVTVLGRRPPGGKIAPGVKHWSADLLEHGPLEKTLAEIVAERGPLSNLIFLQRFKGEGDNWRQEIETSLGASRFVIETLAGKFIARGDKSIVLVSSAASHLIAGEQAVGYHVAKAGLNQLARYYAVTLGKQGIRVNTVSPGTVLKEENREYYLKNTKLLALFEKHIPLGRMGTAEEVAEVISFLCSTRASFITGQNLLVDGGISLLSQETLIQQFARNA
jgi:NAD(P)-dependent dehydrogenase (short-subunit alcohol dehydrogenase family)